MSRKVLRVGIAHRDVVFQYVRDVVAGRRKRSPDDPDIWFSSLESFAKVLSDKNRTLLAMIAQQHPDSIEALAAASGRAKSNLSRTLRTMEQYGLVKLAKGDGRKLRPMVTFERVELSLRLAA
jgi:predicted transcriptional regulator